MRLEPADVEHLRTRTLPRHAPGRAACRRNDLFDL